jgi:hypothetical protein
MTATVSSAMRRRVRRSPEKDMGAFDCIVKPELRPEFNLVPSVNPCVAFIFSLPESLSVAAAESYAMCRGVRRSPNRDTGGINRLVKRELRPDFISETSVGPVAFSFSPSEK